MPWADDGTRLFGSPEERARFAVIAEQVLVDAGVPFVRIAGDWPAREAQSRASIDDLRLQMHPC